MYDIIIIGAGPAGLTAGIYARRAGKSVLILEGEAIGGQIAKSARVVNYPSWKDISGVELSSNMFEQATDFGCEFELETATGIISVGDHYEVQCGKVSFMGYAVIIAVGCQPRRLSIPDPDKYLGHGLGYCVVCDGDFYRGKVCAVIGGGNSACQDALYLSDICPKVYLIQDLDRLTAEQTILDNINAKDNIEVILSSKVNSLIGDGKVSAVNISSQEKERIIDVDGVFVAIGHEPHCEAFSIVDQEAGYILADEDMRTSVPGIFVAGDCRKKKVRQLTTATNDGTIAAINACSYVDQIKNSNK